MQSNVTRDARRLLDLMFIVSLLAVLPQRGFGGLAVKIAVRPETNSVWTGGTVSADCVLLDGNNAPVTSQNDIEIKVEAKNGSEMSTNLSVRIKAGESAHRFTLPASEAGILEIRASQKNLMDGKTFMRVKSRGVETNALRRSLVPPSTPAPAKPMGREPAKSRLDTNSIKDSGAPKLGSLSIGGILARDEGPDAATKSIARESIPSLSTGVDANVGVSEAAAEELGVILKCSGSKCRADGKDAVNIFAFLDEKTSFAPTDISVTLVSSSGELTPVPISIPKGQDSGQAKLTSHEVGTVIVDYVRSKPAVAVRNERSFNISFGPPIIGLRGQSSPQRISLLESADLMIRLVDEKEATIATDEPRSVDLTLTKGSGEFESSTVVIPKNSGVAHLRFLPTHKGNIEIMASTANLPAFPFNLEVTFPTQLITCSLIGGLLGGVLASSISQRRRRHMAGWVLRIAIGCVTGFVIYYFGVLGFISHISRAIALNPFTAVVLSIVGGWLGTEIFTPIARWLGLNNATQGG